MRYSNTRYISLFFCFCIALIIATTAYAQSIIYVNHAATGANDGNSWNDAYTSLQDALQAAQIGDEVWVAAGTYFPDHGVLVTNGNRGESFTIPGGVSLYGGFSGNESSRSERNWIENRTILSGDLFENDDELLTLDNPLRFDNAYHVVRMFDLIDKVILDGFTISGGMANESWAGSDAAVEIQSYHDDPVSPGLIRISNCLFTNNVSKSGAVSIGVAPSPSEPAVLIVDSEIRNNWGLSSAGIDAVSGKTLIRNVLITENEAADTGAIRIGSETVYIVGSVISHNRGQDQISAGTGAALYMWDNSIVANVAFLSPVHIHDADYVSMNNIFTGNSDSSWGNAIFVNGGDTNIINSVFAFNSGTGAGGIVGSGSAIFSQYANTRVSNSIFWDNAAPSNSEIVNRNSEKGTVQINHSLLQYALPSGVTDGGGLISGDPLFQDEDGIDNLPGTIDDDFQLLYWSPAVDAGTNDLLFADFWDLDNDGDFDEFWPTDFYGDPRIIGIRPSSFPVVDLGPFEFNGPPPTAIEEDESPGANGPSKIGVYPNPFASNTSITFTLDHPSEIRIEVYNILGKRVRVLEQGFRAPGEHEVTFDAERLSAGIYFVKLTTGSHSQTQMMIHGIRR